MKGVRIIQYKKAGYVMGMSVVFKGIARYGIQKFLTGIKKGYPTKIYYYSKDISPCILIKAGEA